MSDLGQMVAAGIARDFLKIIAVFAVLIIAAFVLGAWMF